MTLLEQSLRNLPLPLINLDVISTGWLQSIKIDKSVVEIQLKFGFPLSTDYQTLFLSAIKDHLLQIPAITEVRIQTQVQIRSYGVQSGVNLIPGIKNIIAVGSGKGGVGKSTTAVNLAIALQQQGANVGLLDADIYGPNQPHMLGAKSRPKIHEDKTIEPLLAHHLQTMSIGYLVEEATPMVWRGPMISAALNQLAQDTRWSNLDYLLVDLPPGTGDIQLTLAKKIPVSAAVMITTPQDVALLDVRKALEMFRKVNVNVLGVIENMSVHVCSQCGHRESLFGEGGGERLAASYQIPLLGRLPLSLEIREQGDTGTPIVAAEPQSPIGQAYHEIALKLAANLSLQKINYASKFPKIIVE